MPLQKIFFHSLLYSKRIYTFVSLKNRSDLIQRPVNNSVLISISPIHDTMIYPKISSKEVLGERNVVGILEEKSADLKEIAKIQIIRI